jgi:protein-disulfide isomerase
VIEAARRYLGDDLAVAYRHFPLTEIHPHALMAAEASEAAGAQGRFWAMHRILFRNQDALDPADLLEYAAAAECDAKQVAAEFAAGMYTERVLGHLRGGMRSGVHGTPTFYINGYRYDGPWNDLPSFLGALSQASASAHLAARH